LLPNDVGDRAALEDIKVELQERTQRWKKIEKICGFNIITNPGIPYLDSLLRGSSLALVSGQQSSLTHLLHAVLLRLAHLSRVIPG